MKTTSGTGKDSPRQAARRLAPVAAEFCLLWMLVTSECGKAFAFLLHANAESRPTTRPRRGGKKSIESLMTTSRSQRQKVDEIEEDANHLRNDTESKCTSHARALATRYLNSAHAHSAMYIRAIIDVYVYVYVVKKIPQSALSL